MVGQTAYQMKQIKAYGLAEADGFKQHPDVYWQQAEMTPVKTSPKKVTPKDKASAKR